MVRIAICVKQRNHFDTKLFGFLNGNLLADWVHNEKCFWKAFHRPETRQVPVDLGPFASQLRNHLLGVTGGLFAIQNPLQLFKTFQTTTNRHEVRQCPTQPALCHIRHATASGLLHDRIRRLTLRANEQNQTIVRCHPIEELRATQQAADGFLQVDDVNQVTLAVNVRLHLRIPAAGAASEVYASFD